MKQKNISIPNVSIFQFLGPNWLSLRWKIPIEWNLGLLLVAGFRSGWKIVKNSVWTIYKNYLNSTLIRTCMKKKYYLIISISYVLLFSFRKGWRCSSKSFYYLKIKSVLNFPWPLPLRKINHRLIIFAVRVSRRKSFTTRHSAKFNSRNLFDLTLGSHFAFPSSTLRTVIKFIHKTKKWIWTWTKYVHGTFFVKG